MIATPIVYVCIFLIIDKEDEYQLIQYVIQFKGTMFISYGVVRAIIGFFAFLACVSIPNTGQEHSDGHVCGDYGPGFSTHNFLLIGCFFVQLLFVWLAVLLLRYSKEKGRRDLGEAFAPTLQQLEDDKVQVKPGGYLKPFMYYDLCCCLLCCIGVVIVAVVHEQVDDWPVRHAIFAACVIYGFLSLPFFLFLIPGFRMVLTHSVPTAYDEAGRCREIQTSEPKAPEKDEQELIDKDEAKNLLEDARNIMMGVELDERKAQDGSRSAGPAAATPPRTEAKEHTE
jgi:hypothetical protein